MAGAMFSGALKSFAASNISANYEKSPSPSSFCGPWKVYDAKRKKTGQPYSLFVFERKSLDSGASGQSLSLRGSSSRDGGVKAAQDEVVDRLKREASLLARLRHPCVLELVEPVEDTRGGGVQFVTEPVTGSLATLLADKDEEERGGSSRYVTEDNGRRRRREVEIDELEIQKGLEQLGKALEFLHESANLIHGNLTPEAVMVNAKSDWKICGLGFAVNSVKPDLPPNFDPRLPPNVQLNLDYAAPDLVLDQTFSTSCDMFSLGLLMIALYNSPHKSPLETHNSSSTYRRLLSSPSTTPNGSNNFLSSRQLPRPLTGNVLPQLITRRPTGRINARDFQQSEYFDNILVSTLRFLDNFPAKTPSEKNAFMRGLPKILPQFPRSVLEKKILLGLVEELRDGSLLALVLPNIFLIAESATSRLFSEKVLGRLKEVFIHASSTTQSTNEHKSAAAKVAEREREAGKEGGLTVILSKLGLIKEKTTALEFKEHVLPLVFLALDSPTHALQDLALRSLPIIMPKLDFPTLKNDLFPVVCTVFTKTSSLGIKIRGLEAFRVLCGGSVDLQSSSDGLDGFSSGTKGKAKGDEAPALDKYTIQEKVIPLLKGIKTKEPAVMMETLAVFTEIGKTCDREVVAMDILPTLWTMSFGPLLGLEQFKSFMATIKSLSNKIEAEQIQKLRELSSTAQGGQSAGEFLSFGGAPGMHAMNGGTSPGGSGQDTFEALVFGKKGGAPVSDGFEWQSSSNNHASRTSSPSNINRTKSPPNITNTGPKFSWSTPSPTVPQKQASSMNNMLSSSNSLTPMQPNRPSSQNSNAMQPLQPGVGFGSTTALRPNQKTTAPTPATSTSSSGIDWSAAIKPKPSFPSSHNTNNRSGSAPISSNSNGFGMGINNNNSSHPTILYGQTRNQAPPVTANASEFAGFSIPPPPSVPTLPKPSGTNMGFGIPPPPSVPGMGGMNNMGMGMGMGMGMNMGVMQPQKKEEKQGLDKWESLL
ncbi:kinase-like domain-containing protein [Geopyxis carbonaria]|nr:kinase-like domain-containing protein [Geopyxis carbonaria]